MHPRADLITSKWPQRRSPRDGEASVSGASRGGLFDPIQWVRFRISGQEMRCRYSALVVLACGLQGCSRGPLLFDTSTTRPDPASVGASAPEPLEAEPVVVPLASDRYERAVRTFLAALSTGDRNSVRSLLSTRATWSGAEGETVGKSALSEVERFMVNTGAQPGSDHRSPNSPQGVEILDTTTTPSGRIRVAVSVSRPDALRGVWRFDFEQVDSKSPLIEEVTLPKTH